MTFQMGAESQKLCAECMRCLWTRTGIISQNVAGTPKMINTYVCLCPALQHIVNNGRYTSTKKDDYLYIYV